jgi:hypothetical protein
MKNGVYVQDKDMKVQNRVFQNTRSTSTDENGKFSFKARVDDYAILVLEEEGFAQVTVEELSQKPEVTLKPWAKVQGKLMIGSRPGANEEIRLGLAFLPYEYHPRNFAPLSLFLTGKTDEKGEFAFDRVPPINVQVYHSPKVKDETMGTVPTSQTTSFSLKPGESRTLTLGGQGPASDWKNGRQWLRWKNQLAFRCLHHRNHPSSGRCNSRHNRVVSRVER